MLPRTQPFSFANTGDTSAGLFQDISTRSLQSVRVGESAGAINSGIGNAFIGVQDSVMGGHHDLAATLLSQMDISSASFNWSKNLLAKPVRSFAYLPIENYLVWNQPDGWFFYSYDGKKVIERSFAGHRKESNEELMDALAFMQIHYGDYLKY